jgi:hypothetical protein
VSAAILAQFLFDLGESRRMIVRNARLRVSQYGGVVPYVFY